MNKYLVLVIMLMGIMLWAQTGGQTSLTTIPGPLSGCPAPNPNSDIVCDVTGQGWMVSYQGAAYVALKTPAATVPAALACTTFTLNPSGATLSGCK